jgi:hypothetical protein
MSKTEVPEFYRVLYDYAKILKEEAHGRMYQSEEKFLAGIGVPPNTQKKSLRSFIKRVIRRVPSGTKR